MRKVLAGALAVATMAASHGALAQKSGGILKLYHRETPPSASIHEEATISTVAPFMAVYNNLVMFDPHVRKNSLDSIIPDLADSWSWNADRTALTFKLHPGVTWHDGKPFTSADVKCTWDRIQGKDDSREMRFQKNPRKPWYWNLREVTTNGDLEATFHLGQPQTSFLALLAGGHSPVYPCHVSAKAMRTAPIGTGPFKFVEMKQNERITLAKNEHYWKKGLPYLDGIEWTIIRSRSTRALAFTAGEFDMTFDADITIPMLKDVKAQDPAAVCDLTPTGVYTNLMLNRDAPPFDNPKVRQALALTLDRAAFNQILAEGQNTIGGAMMPPPEGVWGMPAEMLEQLPGYGPDVEASRAEGRKLMESLGYSAENPLKIKVATRNIAVYRDPAVILIDHLKHVYVQGELDVIETGNWYGRIGRKDYQVALNLTGVGIDDPDVNFFENYSCGSQRNYTAYCNEELNDLFKKQAGMADQEERRKLVWEIDRRLQLDHARPVIHHNKAATCWQPYVKNVTRQVNSIYNAWRMEDWWLDK
ncbi:MAG: ABC transporter substrate-binding protein [Alphaproteobacteria bacterium]|nr:ABC transporter substrate-binding protein [Alphaproteobacteria bacterium]MCB9929371.1 ABC transporter substrate-binding protein [Alphaproteobacteria bacterium]